MQQSTIHVLHAASYAIVDRQLIYVYPHVPHVVRPIGCSIYIHVINVCSVKACITYINCHVDPMTLEQLLEGDLAGLSFEKIFTSLALRLM